jgi:hypothetical protein
MDEAHLNILTWLPDGLGALHQHIKGRQRPQKNTLTAEEHLTLRERLNKDRPMLPNDAEETKTNI